MKIQKLKDLKCSACSSKTPKLSNIEIDKNILNLNNWSINQDKDMIFKKFIFKNFKKSLNFVNIVAEIAENESHHPDISMGYSYCLIIIHTHAIKGLSLNDFILASKLDLIKI